MERFYVCINGHSFKVYDEGDEPPPAEGTNEIYFGVSCPVCGSIYEIQWPSNRAFTVESA